VDLYVEDSFEKKTDSFLAPQARLQAKTDSLGAAQPRCTSHAAKPREQHPQRATCT